MGELTKNHNFGKVSPGPIYNYDDKDKYTKVINTVVIILASWMGIWNFGQGLL